MKKYERILAVFLSLTLAICMLPLMNGSLVNAKTTVYEAEDSEVCDSSAANKIHTGTSNASGGKSATMYNGQYVTFTVSVKKTGTYNVVMNVAAAVYKGTYVSSIEMGITPNDGNTVTCNITNNNAYNTFAQYTVEVELNAGTNTIKVENICGVGSAGAGSFVNLDYISIEEEEETSTEETSIEETTAEEMTTEESIPDAIGTHEAENATQVNFTKTPVSGEYYSNCSNSSIVSVGQGWIGNTRKYISQKVKAQSEGKYNLVLYYCSTKAVEFMIQVNDGSWTCFDEVENVIGHVSPATGGWNITGTVSTIIELDEGINTINVSGPIVDNSSSSGNYFTVYESSWNNSGSANLDCFVISKYVETQNKYSVTVDGIKVAEIEENKTYTLPTDATYGYFDGTNMYKAGATVTVNSNMAFTSVNTLSVTVANGAGIKLDGEGTSGIRFQATVTSDNMDAVGSDAITEGMLITTNDIFEANDSVLDFTCINKKDYTLKNIVNNGWYNDVVGTYCGSIVKIVESNYIRNFIARAYVTVNYADGTTTTVYSNMSDIRNISWIAQKIQEAGYPGLDAYKSIIDAFAAVAD